MSKQYHNTDFDKYLFDCIKQYPEHAKSMLTAELAKAHDGEATLLHYAAEKDAAEIVERLLELGAKIDCPDDSGQTALMIAVHRKNVQIVDTLLEANADIRITDNDGTSVLHMILHPYYCHHETMKLILFKLYRKAETTDKLVEQLIDYDAGCSFYAASLLEDVNVLEGLLSRGYDVNSKGTQGGTALHNATDMNNLEMMKWLVDNGADIDALDIHGRSPLFYAVEHRNADMVKFLLDMGANPNLEDTKKNTVLFELFQRLSQDEGIECVELLLQHGAVPKIGNRFARIFSIFDWALMKSNYRKIELLTAHLAMLDKLGKSITESVMYCQFLNHRMAFIELEKYHELCKRVLDVVMFDTLTLIDLLTMSEHRMRVLVRKTTFIPRIEERCSEEKLSNKFPYFYNTLFKNVFSAVDLVKLEDAVVPIICDDIINGNHNEFYLAARKIVGYLDKRDLEQLREIFMP